MTPVDWYASLLPLSTSSEHVSVQSHVGSCVDPPQQCQTLEGLLLLEIAVLDQAFVLGPDRLAVVGSSNIRGHERGAQRRDGAGKQNGQTTARGAPLMAARP